MRSNSCIQGCSKVFNQVFLISVNQLPSFSINTTSGGRRAANLLEEKISHVTNQTEKCRIDSVKNVYLNLKIIYLSFSILNAEPNGRELARKCVAEEESGTSNKRNRDVFKPGERRVNVGPSGDKYESTGHIAS